MSYKYMNIFFVLILYVVLEKCGCVNLSWLYGNRWGEGVLIGWCELEG